MPIVIKNADELIYSRFKAKAGERGLRIGEAISEAMEIWLESMNDQNIDQILENRNEVTFRRIFSDLLKQHIGKWGLISNGDLKGVYLTKQACFEAIKVLNLLKTPNLVFPIEKIVISHRILGPYRRVVNVSKL